ncbi:hypothetical protein [Salmonirosea aquatica]|uniref:Lipoprotein n=1 Tax=Salmonirosea aquatica TaxID=2654236 RepID=A0A7C9FQM6_9BACT|nr:hypothetical protein [Cytophagaceae bacterium SJW1-29]
MYRFRLFVLILLTSLGCERVSNPPSSPGYEYFPLNTGQRAEYDVVETTYALAQAPLIRRYKISETVGEKYTDAAGQDVYPIERRVENPQGEWVADSVFIAWRTETRALRAENGDTFVKIQFPAYERSRWNGNLFNTMTEQLYEITSANKPRETAGGTFDNTLTVVQQNDSTLLSLRRSQEIYAEGIGLIQRERTFVQYCGTPDCQGKGIIDYGYSQVSTLTNFTK